jgi:hypothetical protein
MIGVQPRPSLGTPQRPLQPSRSFQTLHRAMVLSCTLQVASFLSNNPTQGIDEIL